MKKVLSLILTLSMILSMAIIPARAADGYQVSVDDATANAGAEVKLNLNLSGNTDGIASLTVYVFYDTRVLTCTSDARAVRMTKDNTANIWQTYSTECSNNFYNTPILDCNGNATLVEGDNHYGDANWSKMTFGYAIGNDAPAMTADGVIGSLTFKVKDGIESCETPLEVLVAAPTNGSGAPITIAGVNGKLTVSGVPPTIKSGANVVLDETTVDVNGTTGGTINATIASKMGTDLTKNTGITWSVDPADKGVSVGEHTGVVTVGAKAKAGTYTVTATADGVNVLKDGDVATATKTFTVTRETPAAVTTVDVFTSGTDLQVLEVPADNTPSTGEYWVNVKSQYGDFMDGEQIDWTITDSTGNPVDGITIAGDQIYPHKAIVTVTKDAAAITDTTGKALSVTATSGGVTSAPQTLTVKRAEANLASFAIDVVAIDTQQQQISVAKVDVPKPVNGKVPLTVVVKDAKDQYGSAYELAENNVSIEIENINNYSGISVQDKTISISNAASRLANQETTVKVKATAFGNVTAETTLIVAHEALTATTVEINGVGDTDVIGVNSSKTYAATVKDQYGNVMQGQDVTWTLPDGTNGDTTNITIKDSTVSVANNDAADGKTAVLTATCNGASDSVTITAKKVSIDFDEYFTLKAPAEITYGEGKEAAFTKTSTTGTAKAYIGGVEMPVTGTFEMTAASLTAGDKTVTVKFTVTQECDYKGTELTKTYNVKVNPKPITATVTAASKTYGEANPSFNFTVPSGALVGNDTEEGLGLTLTTNATAASNVGKYSVTKAGCTSANYDVTVSGENKLTITAKPVTDAMIGTIADQTYTGHAITPVLTVTDSASITADDYTVSYTNNTNAGTATATITGKGNYTGTASKTFTIKPAPLTIESATFADKTFDDTTNATVTGVTFSGLVNTETLTLGTDFTAIGTFTDKNVSYSGETVQAVNASVTVTLSDTTKAKNYSLDTTTKDNAGSAKINPTVTTLTLSAKNAVYTGAAYNTANITKTSNVETVPTYTFYTDSACTTKTANDGAAPTAVGTYYVKGYIAKDANKSAVTSEPVSFQITKAPLTASMIADIVAVTYGKTEKTPALTVNLNESVTLAEGTDYTVAYSNNTNAGTATATITAVADSNYSGTASKTFTINKKTVGLTWTEAASFNYDGEAKSVTATATGLETGDEVNVTVVGGAQTAIGSYTAKATGLTGAAAANYTLPTDESVNKAYTIVTVLDTVTATSEGGALTADVNGLTVKLSGYVAADKSITLTAKKGEADVTITEGETIAAANIGKDKTNTFTAGGVTYTVDTSAVVVNDTGKTLEEKGTETAATTAGGVTVTGVTVQTDNLIEAVAQALVNAVKNLTEGVKELVVKVEVSMKIEVKTDVVTNTASQKTMTVDVHPVVNYKDSGGEIVNGTDADEVINNADIKAPIDMKVKVPDGFVPTHAKHNLGNGKIEWLKVNTIASVATWKQRTFSEVELIEDSRTATVNFTFEDEHGQTISFVPENIGTAFPTDSKSGYTFNGWIFKANDADIASFTTAQKTLTDALLTALNTAHNGNTVALTATADFTQNSTGGNYGGGGGAVTTAEVSVGKSENGTVSANVAKAKKGDTVTVTIKPEDGYKLDTLTVTDKNGKTVMLKKASDTKYTFTMPDGKVSIAATFVEGKTETAMSFADVVTNDWYYDAVKYAYDNGLMNGTGDEKFSPNATTTRGMIFTVLARNAGVDTTGGETWYTVGMNWAKEQGISDGTMPEGNITREQLATMLYRASKQDGSGCAALSFPDAALVSDWAEEALRWCVANGIINGKDGKLVPTGNASRAEVATMLMRFLELDK